MEAEGRQEKTTGSSSTATSYWITNGPDADTLVVYAKNRYGRWAREGSRLS